MSKTLGDRIPTTPPPKLERVAICIATCARPVWLRRLLTAISELAVDATGPEVMVVVCDNDPARSAEPTVSDISATFPWNLVYVSESRRGIPFARNAAVDSARQLNPDAFVFIDDDEIPGPNWLRELLHAQVTYGADVVVGPVHPEYEPEVPEWVRRGNFFVRPHRPSGTPLAVAATNNTLVVRRVVETVGRFFEGFRMNGGDDTDFFMRASLAGALIVSTEEAAVRETVPTSRASAAWLIRRSFRLYNSHVTCERRNLPLIRWLPRRVAAMTGLVASGCAMLPLAVFGGRRFAVRAAQHFAKAAGSISALVGVNYQEYKSVHGH